MMDSDNRMLLVAWEHRTVDGAPFIAGELCKRGERTGRRCLYSVTADEWVGLCEDETDFIEDWEWPLPPDDMIAEAATKARGGRNRYQTMTDLARTFPLFAPGGRKCDAPGLDPWIARRLSAASQNWSHGERAAVQFLLSVFNPTEWEFDMHDALGVWDENFRAPFLAWVRDPWWP